IAAMLILIRLTFGAIMHQSRLKLLAVMTLECTACSDAGCLPYIYVPDTRCILKSLQATVHAEHIIHVAGCRTVGVTKIADMAVVQASTFSSLATLHADGSEEAVQLKVLQTVLTVLQSQLHPKDEESMAIILGICLRLAGSTRQLDCVHSTATATLRQAIALIFDRAASSEGLPVQSAPRQANRVWNTSEPGDISRIVMASR
ncbi:unnamed protein product, partial [Closterium sp. NIES-54]